MLGRTYHRFKRFRSRNEGRLASSAWGFAVGRIYAHPKLRRTLTAILPRPREPQNWAFLVGCYNSGTTILRDVLDAHPLVSTLPREGVKLTSAFPDLQAGGWIRMLMRNRDKWTMPEENAVRIAEVAKRDWGPLWSRKATIYLEKSITHSVRMPWLEQTFGNPYFIVIRRNGYCVCEGIARRAQPTGAAREEIGETYPMRLLAEQWFAVNETIDDALPGLRHVHVLSYEELVEDPLGVVGGLYEFLGLSRPEMAMVEGALHIEGQPFAIRNMNPSSLDRLSDTDRAEAGPIMAPLFEKYGYDV